MDSILGFSLADLRQGSGPLGKCSSCNVLPVNLEVKVWGDEMEKESQLGGGSEG
jgi:hypothetical protein